jgi:hypothetical protein
MVDERQQVAEQLDEEIHGLHHATRDSGEEDQARIGQTYGGRQEFSPGR